MQNLSTHASLRQSLPRWKGDKSCKFVGGRVHSNHPRDELDAILISRNPPLSENTGKKQFSKQASNPQHIAKTHLKTFEAKYQKSTIFEIEELHKLIKVPFHDRSAQGTAPALNAHLQTIGHSKIKALQKGDKQNGIYRNFYKSISSSASFLRSQ